MDQRIEWIYEHLPPVAQSALLSAYGWRLNRFRYGGSFAQHLAELQRTQWLSAADLQSYQDDQTQRLIAHCYANVPHYERLLRELRLTPADFRSTHDLQKLPILDKATLQRDPQLFLARNYLNAPCEQAGTSGSTGTSLRVRIDLEGRRRNYAFFYRLKQWAGFTGGRSATFGGRLIVSTRTQHPPFWRRNYATNTLLLSSYHLAPQNMAAYAEALRSWQPELIESYPSSVAILAQWLLEHNRQLSVRSIITSSETLRPDQREQIELAFSCRVFDQYGSTEQTCFISQCEHGAYHVAPEFGHTELLEVANAPAGWRRIVATGFTNYAMPLLRYDTRDLAMIGESTPCPCCRAFPVVSHIIGRDDDSIVTPSGRYVGRLDPIFKGLATIAKAQIEQDAPDHILVRLVPAAGFSPADIDSLNRQLALRLGDEIQCEFKIVDDIPPGPNGKFRTVIRRIPAPAR